MKKNDYGRMTALQEALREITPLFLQALKRTAAVRESAKDDPKHASGGACICVEYSALLQAVLDVYGPKYAAITSDVALTSVYNELLRRAQSNFARCHAWGSSDEFYPVALPDYSDPREGFRKAREKGLLNSGEYGERRREFLAYVIDELAEYNHKLSSVQIELAQD